MRNFVVILTIVAIFACPLECATKVAADCVTDDNPPTTCCMQCNPKKCEADLGAIPFQASTPDSPAQGEECGWCLCKGGMLIAGPRFSTSFTDVFYLGSWGNCQSEFVGQVLSSHPSAGLNSLTRELAPTRIVLCSLTI